MTSQGRSRSVQAWGLQTVQARELQRAEGEMHTPKRDLQRPLV